MHMRFWWAALGGGESPESPEIAPKLGAVLARSCPQPSLKALHFVIYSTGTSTDREIGTMMYLVL